MTGFLKRDFYLISGTLRFYILLIGLLALFATFSDFNISFLSLYMVIFAMSGMMGLFSYDDMNRWQAYGAAVPAGRRAMVDARCLLAVLLAVWVAAVQFLLELLWREEGALFMAATYGGLSLFYAAVSLPVFYRFGGTKARTVMIAIVAALSSLIGMGATALQLSGGFGRVFPSVAIFALPLTGLAALALSRRISIGIMERKKL